MKDGKQDGEAAKPQPRETPREGPELELELSGSLVRCPFCRGDVDVGDPSRWTACAGCLARHHVACWGEVGHCASCRAPTRLVVQPTAVAAPQRAQVNGVLAFVCVVLVFVTGVTGYEYQQAASRIDALTIERDRARSEAADALSKGYTRHQITLPDGLTVGLSGDTWWVTRRNGDEVTGSVMGVEMPLVGIDRDGVDVSNTGGPSRVEFVPGTMQAVQASGSVSGVPDSPSPR